MIEQLIYPRDMTLTGDLHVHRILPYRARRMVGPFTYLDEMGPHAALPGTAGDILPHPHIGLSTLTWLYEGSLVHRDSLGNVQEIVPGEVNWMTAGRGIVHSERIPKHIREQQTRLHGLQAWVALPIAHEEEAPSFEHYDAREIPDFAIDGVHLRLVAGKAFGRSAPLHSFSRLFYLDALLQTGMKLNFNPEAQEIAFYLRTGSIQVESTVLGAPVFIVFETGRSIEIAAQSDCHGVLLGGDPIGKRLIWWNFVASSQDQIEAAKTRWRDQKFPRVPGENEFIPLPVTNIQREKSTMP